MDLQTIRYKLNNITDERGLSSERKYLSMSQIGDCPRGLYDQLVASIDGTARRSIGKEHQFALDKEIKAAVRERLRVVELLRAWETFEIVASFNGALDDRVCGHLDGEFEDGALLHVKPTRVETLDAIRNNPRYNIPRRHFEQVQMYLRHGEYDCARIVYIARENGDLWLSEIHADERTQDRLDEKAQNVLIAVERREPPVCICRRHSTEIPRPPRRAERILVDAAPAPKIDPRAWQKLKHVRHR